MYELKGWFIAIVGTIVALAAMGTTRIVASPYGYGKNYNYKECLLEI